MNIQYRKEEDYFIPDWEIPKNQQKPLSLYGRLRKAYLEENHSGLFTRMILASTLYDHLYETDRTAQERLDTGIPEGRGSIAGRDSSRSLWSDPHRTCLCSGS